MTAENNGEHDSFEIAPEVNDQIARMMGMPAVLAELAEFADSMSERGYRTLLSDMPAEEAAAELLESAGLLAALRYQTRSVEMLSMFSALGLKEDETTAKLFANARVTRATLLMQIEEGTDSTEYVDAIVAEHEASPFRTKETDQRLYGFLGAHGYPRYFAKWIHTEFTDLQASTEEASVHFPYPQYPDKMSVSTPLLERAMEGDSILPYIDAIAEEVKTGSRKALLMDTAGHAISQITRYIHSPLERDTVNELYLDMLKTTITETQDRSEGPITNDRLYKRLITTLVNWMGIHPDNKATGLELIDEWRRTDSGVLEEADEPKITSWLQGLEPKPPKKRRRRR